LTHAHEPTPVQSDMEDCAYNLFRNKLRPALLCAVPADHPVPSFLGPEHWAFDQPLRPEDARPPGFCDSAASVGVRCNRFYLFQVTAAPGKIAA
jgi:hypothetical protein